jgi:hypothetical protein
MITGTTREGSIQFGADTNGLSGPVREHQRAHSTLVERWPERHLPTNLRIMFKAVFGQSRTEPITLERPHLPEPKQLEQL